jgi:hypothetical protein
MTLSTGMPSRWASRSLSLTCILRVQQLECAGRVARAAANGSSLANIDDMDDTPEALLPLSKGLNRKGEESRLLTTLRTSHKNFERSQSHQSQLQQRNEKV